MAAAAQAKPHLTLVHGFVPADDPEALAVAKLASSGLTIEEGRALGMSWLDAAGTKALDATFWGLPSLKIPYFAPDGRQTPLASGPSWPAFYRVRALRDPSPKPEDFKKYLQPMGTGVCAYFPSTVDWPTVRASRMHDIVITEGELKAAKGAVEGFNAIGLGGVNSYQRKRLGIELLPELEMFEWARRDVYLIFDSDIQANTNVCRALNDLAETLARRGALPRLVLLPAGDDGEKVGLDDFLVANHPDLLRQMMTQESLPLAMAGPLWSLNDRYAYVPSMDRIVRRDQGYLSTPTAFGNAVTEQFFEQVLKDNGSVSTSKVSAAAKWMGWPLRQDVRQLTYAPGLDPLDLVPSTALGASGFDADYNTWSGWGVQPAAGDASPFLELVDHLFSGSPEAAKNWFLQWCAYPLQIPGTKLFSSVVIHGLEQGTGKSLIGYTLGKIYGRNFTEIKQTDLHGGFNEWAIGKQLIMGDDVTGSDKRQDLDMLKKMITQKEIRINAKNQPTYVLPDCINYLWTSNQPDAFFLEDKDRRFFIHEVTVPPLGDGFYQRYDAWMRSSHGPSAVFNWLLKLDLTGFNPFGKALETEAKGRMTRSARSDLGNWVRDLIAMPDELLMIGQMKMEGDLFTNRQLIHAYALHAEVEPATITPKRMSAELARAGVRQVHRGGVVTGKGLTPDRYYAVRNSDKWASATLQELQEHLTGAPAGAAETKRGPKANAPAPAKPRRKKF
jgi:hypothetical protein